MSTFRKIPTLIVRSTGKDLAPLEHAFPAPRHKRSLFGEFVRDIALDVRDSRRRKPQSDINIHVYGDAEIYDQRGRRKIDVSWTWAGVMLLVLLGIGLASEDPVGQVPIPQAKPDLAQ